MRVATTFALALSAAATLVSAQRKIYNATDLTDINNISDNERAEWCRGQRNVCDELCDPASTNDCDYQTLEYDCTCSNGTAPGLEYYRDTLPSFICNRVFSECNAAAVGDANEQEACLEERDSVCGSDALQNAFANSGSDSDSSTTATEEETATTSTTSETGSATADETSASTTGSSDGAEETGSGDDDSLAAPTAAPVFGAAAVAIAALAYLV